jgi:hypothetical protein
MLNVKNIDVEGFVHRKETPIYVFNEATRMG